MKFDPEREIDWSLCTWEGAERDQLRHWMALSLREKLRALEQMCDHARATIEWRQRRSLPYFDPMTGELIQGNAPKSGLAS
jgi:hypothetical protein